MPSKRSRRSRPSSNRHTAFLPLLVLSFALWLIYRGVFHFSVLFDEVIGKAIFFGLPVWLYILISGFKEIAETFAVYKIRRGLMLGLAVGGLFSFATAIALSWRSGEIYQSYAFITDRFWWEFFLGLITSFWETLFFFSFVFLVVRKTFHKWSLFTQVIFVMGVFLLFHLPNTILRFQGFEAGYQLVLLSLFALGQALFFSREKNGYALVLSQTLWGMVLLLNF